MDTGESLDNEEIMLKKLLENMLASISYTMEEIEYHPTTAYKINQWVEENGANLMAMINSDQSFFRKLLGEPIIKKVAFKTQIPFMVLPMAK